MPPTAWSALDVNGSFLGLMSGLASQAEAAFRPQYAAGRSDPAPWDSPAEREAYRQAFAEHVRGLWGGQDRWSGGQLVSYVQRGDGRVVEVPPSAAVHQVSQRLGLVPTYVGRYMENVQVDSGRRAISMLPRGDWRTTAVRALSLIHIPSPRDS